MGFLVCINARLNELYELELKIHIICLPKGQVELTAGPYWEEVNVCPDGRVCLTVIFLAL